MFLESFKHSVAVVTGGSGFVGSHLVDLLVGAGAAVHVFVRHSSSLHHLRGVSDQVRYHTMDLLDAASLSAAFAAVRPRDPATVRVFHLAAEAHVGQSWITPYADVSVNIIGTLNLLRAAAEVGVDRFVIASSSEVYGNPSDGAPLEQGLNEGSSINPVSPQGVTKLAAELLARRYGPAHGVKVVAVRLFNAFGPRQPLRFLTPSVIAQALSGSRVTLGSLDAHRDFLFVPDAASAFAAASLGPSDLYCAGSGVTRTVGEWTALLLRHGRAIGLWGEVELQSDAGDRPAASELWRLRADASRLRQDTGWQPSVPLEDGVARTVEWYAANRSWWSEQRRRA